ncbi:unnamed protein product (macronuclear) [Paramecium tetraurelia]|uniref:Protein kinase domain-containing protein n=1 Tax=Paramecium tetraurelia TaxID=5888 RepID=A0C452_PARTE|nr:uncharacterized protein GSPATT00035049001 [Paramecium tetraurelia]CAK65569.1 unnamed protein product [Paramecium tetraurelia]|eukprot:XP_001432966.1 hypothetical protein (macronuclear) [Paramecium tetraurelia strain d4-2]
MICIRKHALIDQQYVLFIEDDKICIGKNQINPKYVLPINLQSKLEWSFDKELCQFNGFIIEWENKKKLFHMSDGNCKKLKSQIDGKILYNEINSQYFPVQIVGEGTFGKVIKVVSLLDGKEYACKVMKLDKKFSKNDIIYELMTMQSLSHENIIKNKEVYCSNSHFFIIMEYCRGGTLREYLAYRTLNQDQIVMIMKQILNAVIYMNSKGYIHRDIKPENILLREQNDLSNVLVCDFGFAAKVEDILTKHPNCGTPGYMAPEVIKYDQTNPYNEQCDVFSCGSLLYSILTGYNLEMQSEESEIYNIEAQVYEEKQFTSYNNQFKNILLKMLDPSPHLRITAKDAQKYFDNFDSFVLEELNSLDVIQEVKHICIQKHEFHSF